MKKGISILLSLILVTSTMYLTLGTHFCRGEAVESKIILGETHLGCGMMEMEEPYEDSENPDENGVSVDKVPCCQNEYQIVQLTNEFVKDSAQIPFNIEFAVAITYSALNLDLFPKPAHQFYPEYFPPPLEKDFRVLFQTFRI